ncbi:MAG TPA: tRNA 4-thiouridine(8) synthase ThiI, partial [Pseudomonas pachastrellae]|nr:tRNA 4-thiouridine(8) synthase ThiI [Halopseudomonas pachastrellae]
MKLIIKFFPEITIKSRQVRKRFVAQLKGNLKKVLAAIDPQARVNGNWDSLEVNLGSDPALQQQCIERLRNTPGIAHFFAVQEYPLGTVDELVELCVANLGDQVQGKTFAVRCKRVGTHPFSSQDVAIKVGSALNRRCGAAGVSLKQPEVEVHVEIRDQKIYLIQARHEGMGGFPLGTMEPVLSLLSGGFDSTVASYQMLQRGLLPHFVFFNLGGRAHELGVRQVAHYLWERYATSHRLRFVSVPFEGVVAEILQNVENSQMGVVLKRMMLRAADRVAYRLGIDALVTGEAIAQVASQTLPNLSVIDQVAERFVVRPLITT